MATATHTDGGHSVTGRGVTGQREGSVSEATSTASAEARALAHEAKVDARSLAQDAKGEAMAVAEEAKAKARSIAGDARQQLRSQAEEQAGRAAEAMRQLSAQLSTMAGAADGGLAPDLAREASQRIDSFAQRLDGGGLEELVADVKRFARNRPGTFLLGAVAAGAVAGRVARSADTRSLVDAARPSSDDAAAPPTGPTWSQAAETGGVGMGGVDLRTPAAQPLVDPVATQPIPADQPHVAERPLRAPGH
jgi:hypothetical protein